jgi:hypothetical protein
MNKLLWKLKAPFPVKNLSWRVGQKTKDKKKAMMLVYIDARDVQDRLDEVCGVLWESEFHSVNGKTICRITINGKSREDGAGDTEFEAEKGGISDAFKRAAVQWGIGRYLYDAKNFNTWVNCEDMNDYEIYKNNKEQLDTVAALLGRDHILYPMFLQEVKDAFSVEEIESIKEEARIYAKRERWNQSQLETFKKNCEKKIKELVNEENEGEDNGQERE